MYNPEKQARVGGKFGGKIVAEVTAVEQDAVQIVSEAYKRVNEAINRAEPGEIVSIDADPFDYPTITNKRTGWALLAVAVVAIIVVLALTGCITVRH